MTLRIENPEIERLARALAEQTGESIDTAMRTALEQRLRRLDADVRRATLLEDLAESRRRWSALPVQDSRHPDEILGYDETGLPR